MKIGGGPLRTIWTPGIIKGFGEKVIKTLNPKL